jgi:dynein heavy chain
VPLYAPVPSYEALKKVLEEKLAEYNETNAVMDLVLFQQALEHVTRIARIIDQPRCACVLGLCAGGAGVLWPHAPAAVLTR